VSRPGRRADEPSALGDLVRQALHGRRPDTPAKRRLAGAFVTAAGADVAGRVHVRGRRGTRLLLETDSPALRAELQGFRASAILAAWPADPPAVPIITALHVRLASGPLGCSASDVAGVPSEE